MSTVCNKGVISTMVYYKQREGRGIGDQLFRSSRASAMRATLVSNLSSMVMRPLPSSMRSSRSWRSWSCKFRLVLSNADNNLSSIVSGRLFRFFLFVGLPPSSCFGHPASNSHFVTVEFTAIVQMIQKNGCNPCGLLATLPIPFA